MSKKGLTGPDVDGVRHGGTGLLAAPLILGLCAASAAFGQVGGPFDLSWNTFDGGGYMFSTGGGYELGGTIGQPDASVTVMTGGTFELAGGFWFSKIVCNSPPQDADADADVDLTDFQRFQACFNGPNRAFRTTAAPEACVCFDQDEDADVDLLDFGRFQTCFNGPNRTPKCG
jgi:hypothetical protein